MIEKEEVYLLKVHSLNNIKLGFKSHNYFNILIRFVNWYEILLLPLL